MDIRYSAEEPLHLRKDCGFSNSRWADKDSVEIRIKVAAFSMDPESPFHDSTKYSNGRPFSEYAGSSEDIRVPYEGLNPVWKFAARRGSGSGYHVLPTSLI